MPRILKVSSQGQVTLPRALWREMGEPSYFEAALVNRDLVLRVAHRLTLEEAEARYGAHGITSDVLREALRIVREKEAAGGQDPA